MVEPARRVCGDLRGYPRYVASPYPIDVVEKEAINHLLDDDYLLITDVQNLVAATEGKAGTQIVAY